MDGSGLIQISVQLPAGALEHFSRLVGQLRQLAAEASAQSGWPAEQGESSTFDTDRFQALRRGPDEPESVRVSVGIAAEAEAAGAQVQKEVREPSGAGEAAVGPAVPEDLPLKNEPVRETRPDSPPAAGEAPAQRPEPPVYEAQAVQAASGGTAEEIPPVRVQVAERLSAARTVQAEPESPVAGAPAVRMDPASQIPEAEAIWAKADEQGSDVPAVQAELATGAEPPRRAGFAVTAGPETAQNRWTSVTEELVAAASAPLTAEAVSQAFRRDGRRYDNGFPLY